MHNERGIVLLLWTALHQSVADLLLWPSFEFSTSRCGRIREFEDTLLTKPVIELNLSPQLRRAQRWAQYVDRPGCLLRAYVDDIMADGVVRDGMPCLHFTGHGTAGKCGVREYLGHRRNHLLAHHCGELGVCAKWSVRDKQRCCATDIGWGCCTRAHR